MFKQEENDKKARVGAPLTNTRVDKGLSTSINGRDRDAMGNKLSPAQRSETYKLRIWQNRLQSQSSVDRDLSHTMRVLNRVISQIGLQRTIKEHSAIIYRRVVEKGRNQGAFNRRDGVRFHLHCHSHEQDALYLGQICPVHEIR